MSIEKYGSRASTKAINIIRVEINFYGTIQIFALGGLLPVQLDFAQKCFI